MTYFLVGCGGQACCPPWLEPATPPLLGCESRIRPPDHRHLHTQRRPHPLGESPSVPYLAEGFMSQAIDQWGRFRPVYGIVSVLLGLEQPVYITRSCRGRRWCHLASWWPCRLSPRQLYLVFPRHLLNLWVVRPRTRPPEQPRLAELETWHRP